MQIRFALRCTAFSQSFGSPRSRVQRVSCLLSPVFMSYKWKPFSRIIFHCQRCQKGEASAAHHPDNVIKTRMINPREEDACVLLDPHDLCRRGRFITSHCTFVSCNAAADAYEVMLTDACDCFTPHGWDSFKGLAGHSGSECINGRLTHSLSSAYTPWSSRFRLVHLCNQRCVSLL